MTAHDEKSGQGKRLSPQIREFKGVNLTDARQAIEDGEFAWLENAMTVGKGLVQLTPAAGPTVVTLAQGIASMTGVVLSANPVLIVVGSDGSLTQVTPAGIPTTIAAAGTVTTAAKVTMWRASPVLILDPVKGYFSWDGTTFTTIDATKLGTSLAVYSGRAWLLNGRTRLFTAPGTYNDFTAGNGSGSSVLTDESFPGNIVRGLSALDQLWQFGGGAINAISNVQVPTGSTQPTYSDTNIVSTIGTVNPASIVAFFRAMAFMTAAGVYSLVGVTPQKLSDKLDGLFPLLTLTPDTPAALLFLGQLPVLCFLVTYQDPVGGPRPLLLCYSQGKWFFGSQGALTWITSLLVNGAWQGWGTDGTNIYRLFGAAATTPVAYKIQSKLFDFGSAVQSKEAFKFMLEFSAPYQINPTITLDTGFKGSTIPITLTSVVTWVNNVRQTVTWQNVALQTVPWITAGMVQAFAKAEMQGTYLGWTIAGTDPPWKFSGVAMEIEPRTEW